MSFKHYRENIYFPAETNVLKDASFFLHHPLLNQNKPVTFHFKPQPQIGRLETKPQIGKSNFHMNNRLFALFTEGAGPAGKAEQFLTQHKKRKKKEK